MNRISVLLAIGFCVAAGQDGKLMSGWGSTDEAHFYYETRLEPPGPGTVRPKFSGGIVVYAEVFHRYMADMESRQLFGYDIRVEPGGGANMLRVTFSPLTLTAAKLKLKEPATWTMLPSPKFPLPQLVADGDRLALDLLVNPSTAQKVVDYVRIGAGRYYEGITVAGPARDFTVQEAELRLVQPEVLVDGEARAKIGGSVTGSVGYLIIPGQGRFIFSLAPYQELGFLRSGEVRGDFLSFQWGSSTYKLRCKGKIAPGPSAYHLYVLHDPKPSGNEILVGSSDRAGLKSPAR
jgi:hypothetical protein